MIEEEALELSPREIRRMTLAEALGVIRGILSIDPHTIRSESDLGKFAFFPDASWTVAAHILEYSPFTSTGMLGSPLQNLYETKWVEFPNFHHRLCVSYPIDQTARMLDETATDAQKREFIRHTTPGRIELVTGRGEKEHSYFDFGIQQYFEAQLRPHHISAVAYDEAGVFQRGVHIPDPLNKYSNPDDFQFAASSIQGFSRTLMIWKSPDRIGTSDKTQLLNP